nr:S-layer homology domain-containing protein [uncultured Aminipila sp.]
MSKKLITAILLAVCVVTAPLLSVDDVSAGNCVYSDIKTTNWAYNSVQAMSEKGIINGYPDGTFKPSNTVTYGEFIKMMIASMGYNLPNAESGKHWAYNYYETATGLQLFSYAKIPTSMLDKEIPREMMAYLISQALGDIDIKYYDELKAEITDIKEGDEFIYPIVKAYSTGILNGYPDGTFKQKATLTRAETAKVLQNFVKVMNGEVIKKYEKEQKLELEKSQKTYVESFLQSTYTMSTGMTSNQYDYYGVDSAQELKETHPLVYYSVLENNNPLFSSLVSNTDQLKSPFADYKDKTYAYKNMADIGITKIEKKKIYNPALKYKYDMEEIVVTPKYKNTEGIQAVLIKGNKIVCTLTGSKKEDGSIGYGISGKVVGDAYISLLPDFDYIGFYEYTGEKTVFLIKKPF